MANSARLDRRSVMKVAGVGALAAMGGPLRRIEAAGPAKADGHIKQSVCRWCYNGIPLEKLADGGEADWLSVDRAADAGGLQES